MGPGYRSSGYILGCSQLSLPTSGAQLGLGIDCFCSGQDHGTRIGFQPVHQEVRRKHYKLTDRPFKKARIKLYKQADRAFKEVRMNRDIQALFRY